MSINLVEVCAIIYPEGYVGLIDVYDSDFLVTVGPNPEGAIERVETEEGNMLIKCHQPAVVLDFEFIGDGYSDGYANELECECHAVGADVVFEPYWSKFASQALETYREEGSRKVSFVTAWEVWFEQDVGSYRSYSLAYEYLGCLDLSRVQNKQAGLFLEVVW